jgi:RimJ/RimL family protein N-acetyltransferase
MDTTKADLSAGDGISLRPTALEDLPALFRDQADPAYAHMAAFTAKDETEGAFVARWTRLLASASVASFTIVDDAGAVLGSVAAYGVAGEREVCFGVARRLWGRGVASRALALFLRRVSERPLIARAADDNLASLRVLAKNGFAVTGASRFAANARGGVEIGEVELSLA